MEKRRYEAIGLRVEAVTVDGRSLENLTWRELGDLERSLHMLLEKRSRQLEARRQATVCRRLREAREAVGLEVTLAARIAGVTPPTLRRVEAGGYPSLRVLHRLVRAYGADFVWVVAADVFDDEAAAPVSTEG